MNWIPLKDCRDKIFGRSVVFLFPAVNPFEEIVDFMIIEEREAPIELKLICSTGYHAGQTELVFPLEAKHSSGGLSVKWLQENWEEWVYPHCKINEVKYIDNYLSNYG